MMRFQCKSCHQTIKIEEKYANRSIRCPRCKCVIKVSERLPAAPSGEEPLSVDSAGKFSSPVLIKFRCKFCHQKIRIGAQYADKKVYCPRCKKANTVSSSQVPAPSKPKQPSASDDNIAIHFRTPRRPRRDGDPADTLERELLDLPDPTPETAPVSISASDATENLETRRVPAPESETHPGPLPQELFDKYKPKRSARLKTGIKFLVIMGFVGGVTYGVIQWQQNRSTQTFLQQASESESIQAGVKQTESYSFSEPKENTEKPTMTPAIEFPNKENQLAYIQSLLTFAGAAANLRTKIDIGMDLKEFILQARNLSRAYYNIKVSPEVQVYLDIELLHQAKQYDQGVVADPVEVPSVPNSELRNIPHGDREGYRLYKTAQHVKKLASTLAHQWNPKNKISLHPAEIVIVSDRETHTQCVQGLQRLLTELEEFEKKYMEHKR
jgi:phage FluMu protein Com